MQAYVEVSTLEILKYALHRRADRARPVLHLVVREQIEQTLRAVLDAAEQVPQSRAASTDLSDAVKQAAAEGQCFANAMANIKLPKYEKWAGYATGLPVNIERFCEFWLLGIQ